MYLICENCGLNCKFEEIGYDEVDNRILECQECGAICYEDGTLIEDDVIIVK